MRILIITPDYPDYKRNRYTFVKQLVDQFAIDGHDCCVIAPFSVTKYSRFSDCQEVQKIDNGVQVKVLRPNYMSFSTWQIAGFQLSRFCRDMALRRALRRLPFQPDIIYAHFWRSGREIYLYAKEQSIPLFVACGESVIPQSDINPQYQNFYDYVKGVICVSSKNMVECIANGMTTKEKCLIIPNAINPRLFYQKDRLTCRKELGFSNDAFIVAFCGAFIHRKGVRILSDAINRIQGQTVFSLFVGRKGDENPYCNHILFQGEVAHKDVATYLSAADVFVLPTLHEGCSNAIIEAMACGLPIISSDLPFNKDILNNSNSILVNPNSEEDIAKAIVRLRDDKLLRHQLKNGALSTAHEYNIERRSEIIMDFMIQKARNNNLCKR